MLFSDFAFVAIQTGGAETPDRVRSSVAFDLTGLDLRGRNLVTAVLHVHCPPAMTVRLTDPSGQSVYGCGRAGATAGVEVPLTIDALCDLELAGGGFFALDAEFLSEAGDSRRVPREALAHPLVLTLEESVRLAAA